MLLENEAKWDDTNCRYQDLVGIVSGVSLRQVVKVLRATELISGVCGRTGLADEIAAIMAHSAKLTGDNIALDAIPSADEVDAVADFHQSMCKLGHRESMQDIRVGSKPN